MQIFTGAIGVIAIAC